MCTRIQDVKEGDVVVVDGGFSCMLQGSYGRVLTDKKGEKYIRCLDGRHYLDGQVDDPDTGVMVGITKVGK